MSLLVVTFSCNDAIDIEQPGRLTEDRAFETVDDLQRGILGVYAAYDTTQEISLSAAYTDEVAPGIATGGQNFATGFIFDLNAGSTAASVFWSRHYLELNRINRVLEAAALIEPTEDEQDEYNNIVGVGHALRAYSHFQLLSHYSTDYANDDALAIPLQTSVPSIADQPLRNTNAEVYAQIEEDLNLADGLLTEQSSATRTFVSKDFVLALRARVAAYKRDYTTALSAAQSLVNRYPLANRTNFQLMWLDASNEEIIFKLERTLNGPYDFQGSSGSVAASGWVGNIFAFTNATAGGGAYYEFSRNLFNLFDEDDIRTTAYLAPSSIVSPDYQNAEDFANEDVLVVGKYPGSEGQNLMNDLKVFRVSEMLLIMAEAYAHNNSINGPNNSVASVLKQLRDARFDSPQDLPTFGNQTEAFNAILNERRVEFAFEGHRWKDIKRLGERANQNIVRDPLDCAPFANGCELPSNSFKLTLPIPIVELNGNPGLRAQQNPGY